MVLSTLHPLCADFFFFIASLASELDCIQANTNSACCSDYTELYACINDALFTHGSRTWPDSLYSINGCIYGGTDQNICLPFGYLL
jgi:hypothetical protein